MPGTFELYKDAGGEFRFRFNASNGQTILSSEGYKQRSNAENGINSVKKNAAEDARYEPKETNDGRFMFNLKASNGQVVGSSRIYKTASERDQGINTTKSDAPGAETDDLT